MNVGLPRAWKEMVNRRTVKDDAAAGLVLGVANVPAGLASGLLAGVNPLAGLYGYLFGTFGGALVTSTPFMAVQATGAMCLVVADTDLASRSDPQQALFTLSILTGAAMILAGILRFGALLRFVPSAVMVGFISAVGILIVLGQLDNFTGYDAAGGHRLTRTLDLLTHPGRIDWSSLVVGVLTIVLIVVLQRTRLGALGMVVAIGAGSALAAVLNGNESAVRQVRDLATIPNALPSISLPALGDVLFLLVPAVSLAFVGLVQGAAVSAGFPNPDGSPADASLDFMGQGAGNVLAGLFQGMPVGGSMSSTALVVQAGARTRLALVVSGFVMAIVVLAFGDVVGYVAMPALAGLLIVVGFAAIKPARIQSVAKTGVLQSTVMVITFALTMLIPLQFAVLVGVALAILLYVVQESNNLEMKRIVFEDDGRVRETEPPASVGRSEVIVVQPYGSLFFASAPVFEAQLPTVDRGTWGSVVVVRLRGVDQLGLSSIEVFRRYSKQLRSADSKLKIVVASDRVIEQFRVAGADTDIGSDDVYLGTEWLGETVRRAYDDSQEWVEAHHTAG